MATPPVFSVGQYNTAAYMNSIGLWLIKSQTVGTGVSSVTVSDVFSSDYENYKIVWSGGYASAAGELSLRLGSSTANYFGFLTYGSYTGSTLYGVNDSAQSSFRYVGGFDAFYCSLNVDLFGPYLSRVTTINAAANYGAYSFGNYGGRHAETVSYSAFTVIPNTGTLTGGTISVYGYRK